MDRCVIRLSVIILYQQLLVISHMHAHTHTVNISLIQPDRIKYSNSSVHWRSGLAS